MTNHRKTGHSNAPDGCSTGLIAFYRRGDVVHAVPSGAERLAHVVYTHPVSGKTYSGDIFLTDSRQLAGMPTTVDLVAETASNATYQIVAAHLELVDHVRALFARDLRRFVDNDERFGVSPVLTNRVEVVATIEPSVIVRMGNVVVEDGAKQLFHDSCCLDLVLDFATWCATALTPEGYFTPGARCLYCYAKCSNARGFPFVGNLFPQHLVAQIQHAMRIRAERGLPTRCLRLGAKTDAGHPLFREYFAASLEAGIAVGLSVAVPTKYPTFHDPETTKLLIRARAIVMPSFGADELEPGAVSWGMTQEARIEGGIKLQEAGVTTVPFVAVDPSQELGGDAFRPVVGAALRHFDRVQLLPIRLRNKALARQVLGGWDELVLPGPNGEPPRFEAAKNVARIPLVYHPSITALIGDNTGTVRMCAHNSQQSHCGKCFVPGEVGTVTGVAPATVLAPLAKAEITTVPPIISANIRGRGRSS